MTPYDMPITTVRRVDFSGTTRYFTKALKEGSTAWAERFGEFFTPFGWPMFDSPSPAMAGFGSSGIAALIRAKPGAIGYLSLYEAERFNLTVVQMTHLLDYTVGEQQVSSAFVIRQIERGWGGICKFAD